MFKEFFKLIVIKFKTTLYNLGEYFKTVYRYYSNWRFAKIDLTLLLTYFWNTPFVISKRFLQEKGANDPYTYGETPLTTLDEIMRKCKVTSQDVVYELGCGRGRNCFWLDSFIGCKVVGIEYIPDFISKANYIKDYFQVDQVEFRLQNISEASYNDATVLYLYGTCLEDPFLFALMKKFEALPIGTKIITISYPLSDYSNKPLWEVMNRFPARFTWGTADVYLQIKKG